MAKQQSTWKKLASVSSAARRAVDGALSEAERAVTGGSDAISGAKALSREVAAWEKDGASFAARGRDLLKRLENESRTQSDTLEQRLTRELVANGHAVFGETALLVVDGIVHVQVDVAGGGVKINETLVEDLEIKVMAEQIHQELAKLKRLVTSPPDFLSALSDAYDREIRATGVAIGSQVHATAVAVQIALQRQSAVFRGDPSAKHYREYPRVLFRADLYTLLGARETKVRGRRFHHAAGADTSGAVFMLIPALGRMAHLGRIWFESGGD